MIFNFVGRQQQFFFLGGEGRGGGGAAGKITKLDLRLKLNISHINFGLVILTSVYLNLKSGCTLSLVTFKLGLDK